MSSRAPTQRARELVFNSTGVLELPLAIALFSIGIAGFGLWGVLRTWRHSMEIQLELDRCVGIQSILARNSIQRIEKTNLGIRTTRAAIEAAMASAQLQLLPPLRAALSGLVAEQTAEQAVWEGKRIRWVLPRPCADAGATGLPYVSFPYERDVPDDLGPVAPSWREAAPGQIRIEARHGKYAAAAVVREVQGQEEDANDAQLPEAKSPPEEHPLSTQWHALWTRPRSIPTWTSFP